MEILPWLIPGSTSSQVNAALALVCYESSNGYDHLWRILELTIPGFDPVISIQIPVWTGVDNIFSFAQEVLLYFRLQEKINFHFDNQRCSSIFLRAIQYSEFADTPTVLQTQINSFRFEYNDRFLPPHLHFHGLATSIHQNSLAQHCGTSCSHDHWQSISDSRAPHQQQDQSWQPYPWRLPRHRAWPPWQETVPQHRW
jgi:hypothetical protein